MLHVHAGLRGPRAHHLVLQVSKLVSRHPPQLGICCARCTGVGVGEPLPHGAAGHVQGRPRPRDEPPAGAGAGKEGPKRFQSWGVQNECMT